MRKRPRNPEGVNALASDHVINPLRAWFVWVILTLTPVGVSITAAEAADAMSPVGLWKTIDDKTGRERAIVRVYEDHGLLFGRIEHSFVPGAETRVCVLCSDERKNQPIIGLVIIRNLKADGAEYDGGDILDPESGSVYRCKIHLDEGGTRLVVRGYIGVALLGRTQIWQRQN
jgi:uncharacterized protein (DUF2147 family)